MLETLLDLDHLHVFLRGSDWVSDGVKREHGEVLDTSTWRPTRVKTLIENRTVSTAPYTLPETMVTCACHRRWVDQEAADRHTCPEEND